MQNYAPGNAVKVSLDLKNEAGDLIAPTALRWRVLDEAEAVLQDWTALALPSDPVEAVQVTVIGPLNILTPPATRGMRSVELEVTTDEGVFTVTREFLLQGSTALQLGYNTFATYNQAVLASQDYSDEPIAGWSRAEARDERERALIQAHQAIMLMPLKFKLVRADPQASQHPAFAPTEIWLADLLPELFVDAVPAHMRKALLHAQLLEASAVLNADPVVMARRNGLMSMTVGESSQFFGQSKPLETPMLSRHAMDLLKPWLNHTVRLSRGS